MSLETQNGASIEKKDLESKNPEVIKIIDSVGFRESNTLKKLSTLSPESQAGLLPGLQDIYGDHQLRMEAIQGESKIGYQKALNNPISL